MLERREEILLLLRSQEKVTVHDLSEHFHCSEVTIRTDLRELEAEGKLERTHGGAVPVREPFPSYRPENLYRNAAAKQQIASCAYRMIYDRETIILDDSSSSFYLALEIRRNPEKRLAVVTNSILAVSELSGLPHVDLYLVGGSVSGNLPASLGSKANEEISRFKVDKAFIGVHGISFDAGLTAITDAEMQMKQSIIRTTSKVIVLADSSRFGGGYFSVICPLSGIFRVVTDSGISQENVRKAALHGVPLIIADQSGGL
ncbi:MAG: DeoR/GlpR transcriptional regulator [Stomatobaculum sp.]|nr:DeoR/GlpR transcriptional regulator [Stomatobaculum sp.]